MTNIQLKYSHSLTTCDPQWNPVLIIGQLKHLKMLSFDVIKCKLEPRVPEEVKDFSSFLFTENNA